MEGKLKCLPGVWENKLTRGFAEGKEEQIKYHLAILVTSYANGHEPPCMEGKGEPLCG